MQISPEGKIGIALGLLGLLGGGAVVVAPNQAWLGWTMVAVALIGFALLGFHHFFDGQSAPFNLFKKYRMQWPIAKIKGWPWEIDLEGRIYHARTYINFDKLELENYYEVTIVALNTSPYELEIERISGNIIQDRNSGPAPFALAWDGKNRSVPPLGEFRIMFVQRIESDEAARMLESFKEGKLVPINFGSVGIVVKAIEIGEIAKIRLWDGAGCRVSNAPVVTGTMVSFTTAMSTETGATLPRP